LANCDDVNLLGGNISIENINTGTLIDTSKEVDVEANVEKSKLRRDLVTRMISRATHKIANGSFENMSQFKYLGMTVTDQNIIQEEIKRRLNFGILATIQSRTFCLLFYR
jgi:hypothetical protein